jgi:hypothetical protein
MKTESLPEIQIIILLRTITKNEYSFSSSSVRIWGHDLAEKETPDTGFYQLMPDSIDDGFFDWYCDVHPYHQFFETKDAALINFIYYWFQWKESNEL